MTARARKRGERLPEAAGTISPSIRLDFAGGRRLGPGKIALLEAIIETGSISAAGRRMEMSYRRAWLLVDAVNRMFDQPVVVSAVGGPHGGGAQVTEFGSRLVSAYRALEQRLAAEANADFAEFRAHYDPRPDPD